MTDLISRRADVRLVWSLYDTETKYSSQILEILEILVAHDWDINQPICTSRRPVRIMWSLVLDRDLLA